MALSVEGAALDFGNLGENILVGLIGGAVVSFVMWASRRYRDWRLTRKYPIAGTYVTQFEDEENGQSVVSTAPATIRQQGRKITGDTVMGNRKWVLSGSLSTDGYIHGVYSASDPIDKGIGNFFLRVSNDRSMDGLWSGYDSVNGKITSGRYRFQPMVTDVSVRDATSADNLAILKVADDQLGANYLSGSSLDAIHEGRGFALIAEVAGEVVGFSVCLRQTISEAEAMMKRPPPRYMQYAEHVGVLKTVAVDDRFQGRSLGSMLVEASIERFRIEGTSVIYTVAWKSAEGTNIEGIIQRMGFADIHEVPGYWEQESLDESFSCPVCVSPPCECSAVIAGLVLPGVAVTQATPATK